MSDRIERDHSKNVTAWLNAGSKGPCPIVDSDPIKVIFAKFNEIFPDIELFTNTGNKHPWCRRGTAEYNANEMSDGEKQVFSLLVDLLYTENSL